MNAAAPHVLSLLLAVVLGATVAAPTLGRARPVARAPESSVPVLIQLAPSLLDTPSVRTGPRASALARAARALEVRGAALRRALVVAGAADVRPLALLPGFAARLPVGRLAALARRADVAVLSPDRSFRLSPTVSASSAAAAVGEGRAALRLEALDGLGLDGSGVVVAALDTGVDPAHLALAGRWRGPIGGWFDPYGQQASPADLDGHGTGVLGVLLGAPVGGLPAGVAFGATWIAGRVFDDAGDATLSGVLAALGWVLDPDGDPETDDAPEVLNLSWGFDHAPGTCARELEPAMRALRAADILVVASAGNSGPAPSSSVSPANLPGVLAVGALTAELAPVMGSSRGPGACDGRAFPDLAAPAMGVVTADLTFGGLLPTAQAIVDGTSFAAPVVAGLAARLRGAYPDLSAEAIGRALREGAFDLERVGTDPTTGFGLPDASAAFEALRWRGSTLLEARPADGAAAVALLADAWERTLRVVRLSPGGGAVDLYPPVSMPTDMLAATAWRDPGDGAPHLALLERLPGRRSLRLHLDPPLSSEAALALPFGPEVRGAALGVDRRPSGVLLTLVVATPGRLSEAFVDVGSLGADLPLQNVRVFDGDWYPAPLTPAQLASDGGETTLLTRGPRSGQVALVSLALEAPVAPHVLALALGACSALTREGAGAACGENGPSAQPVENTTDRLLGCLPGGGPPDPQTEPDSAMRYGLLGLTPLGLLTLDADIAEGTIALLARDMRDGTLGVVSPTSAHGGLVATGRAPGGRGLLDAEALSGGRWLRVLLAPRGEGLPAVSVVPLRR